MKKIPIIKKEDFLNEISKKNYDDGDFAKIKSRL